MTKQNCIIFFFVVVFITLFLSNFVTNINLQNLNQMRDCQNVLNLSQKSLYQKNENFNFTNEIQMTNLKDKNLIIKFINDKTIAVEYSKSKNVVKKNIKDEDIAVESRKIKSIKDEDIVIEFIKFEKKVQNNSDAKLIFCYKENLANSLNVTIIDLTEIHCFSIVDFNKTDYNKCYNLERNLETNLTYFFEKSENEIESENENTLENELENSIDEQLSNLDLIDLENLLNSLTDEQKSIFGASGILDKLQAIISGEFGNDTSSVFEALLKIIFDEILKLLPFIASIIAIAILAGLLSDFKGNSQSIGDIIHFVCYGVIITIIASSTFHMITLTTNTINLIVTQMEIVFPILLTLLTAMGGTMSVAIYQPAVILLTSIVTQIFTHILMPIFIFSLVFLIVSNLSNSVKLDKLSGFLNSLFKWIIGIVFTIFMGFLAIKGITAGSIDSISFKTARYSLSTYIPILGGYLSEGLNVILASCLLIKNAVGASGLLLLFASIIIPLLQLILFMLCLKFTGAILQPLSDNRISNFISSISKLFIMPIIMIIGVAFMYVIFVGIIMCTSISF